MGCCLGRPSTDILHDPSVSAHARVGDIAIVGQYGQTIKIEGCCSGLMYIKEDILYYETVCSGYLCCQCCGHSFNVRDITSVEVVQNHIARFGYGKHLYLNPGLKITVQSRSGASTIIVAMPDAQEFAGQLNEFANQN